MALDEATLGQLRETVRRFVGERLIPLEAQVAEDDVVPESVVEEMRALGLFGLSIPEEYGGLGLSMFDEVQIAFEFGRTSPTTELARTESSSMEPKRRRITTCHDSLVVRLLARLL